jgi:hypothetical protein
VNISHLSPKESISLDISLSKNNFPTSLKVKSLEDLNCATWKIDLWQEGSYISSIGFDPSSVCESIFNLLVGSILSSIPLDHLFSFSVFLLCHEFYD